MPSKTSRAQKTRPSRKRAEPGSCNNLSEEALKRLASDLAARLRPGDRVFLEGEMGTGKTTFARFLLEALGQGRPAEGSPTFPIAHEYKTRLGPLIHIDFYRLVSEAEIEQTGILSYYWERDAIVLSEWLSRWKSLALAVRKQARDQGQKIFEVLLEFSKDDPERRNLRIKPRF